MSNCEIIELSPLQVQRHQLRQAVQCLAHTILFCRSLGTVRPQPVECPALNSSYMSCGDPGVATVVEDGASAVERWADKELRNAVHFRVVELDWRLLPEPNSMQYPGQEITTWIGFYEKKTSSSWMGQTSSRVYWERWVVRISVVDAQPRMASAEQLERCMAEIITAVNTKREHIPPIQQHSSKAALPFHFDVEVPRLDKSILQTGFSTIKRMLMQTSPPPVLT